ncbi:hypothetical protein BX266_1794 [Streptomyces sp. TLI_171]|nr:hypothetical protein BX266_1794 [Streptomyces sp. TLI_171]
MLRPVAVLWSLLLAALLALLPCAAGARTLSGPPAGPQSGRLAPGSGPAVQGPSAEAATAVEATGSAEATGSSAPVTPVADRSGAPRPAHHAPAVAVDSQGSPYVWCAVDGSGPLPGHGCSDHAFCGPQSHLPNAPPQPGTVVLPRLIAPAASAAAEACAVGSGPHHAPDLHVLQVHRS